MSLIHWDKSVLRFHFQEILEDHQAGDRTALLGLGAILFGTIVMPATVKFGRPVLKQIIKTGLLVYGENQDNPQITPGQKKVVEITTAKSYKKQV